MGIASTRVQRFLALRIVLAGMLLACRCALALDPTLNISQYAHTTWRVRDGFVKGIITSLAQTPDGYMWLGTELGLLRFDGVRAVSWQPPAGQQLPGSLITSLLAARDGTLWIGTFSGLATWKSGKLRQFPELAGQKLTSLLEARDGTVWIGIYGYSEGGLCDIRSGVVHCERDSHKFGTGVRALYEDSKGTLWLGLSNGLWRWRPSAPEFFSMPEDPFGVTSFIEDEKGQLLFGSYAGIRRLLDGRVEPYPLSGSAHPWHITRMFRDHDGGLWVGTSEHGLVHIDEHGRTDGFSHPDGLSGDYVTRFLEDREGSVWVATFDGIDRFRTYAIPTISTKQGLSNTVAWSVLASRDGNVWIATSSALNLWKNEQISLFGSGGGTQKSDGKLNGQPPTALFQDSSGRIWISTTNSVGYLQVDRFVPIRGVPRGTVQAIAEVPSEHLWLSHQQAGLLHVFQGRVLQQIPWTKLGHEDFAKVLVADPSRRGLWFGFNEGGVAYFADGAIRASYSAENGLGQGHVTDLRFGFRGALWAATDTGLSRLKDSHVTTLTSKNGLPCDKAIASMEDNDHSIWLYLACGLVRITEAELDAWVADPSRVVNSTLFDNSDGVRGHTSTGGYQPRMTKSTDGRIWFSPWDGVSIVDPAHLPFNKLPPPVHIEQIIADHKTYEATPDANGQARLPPLIRDLQIDYTALSLVAPEKVLFRYKLEGWDRDWQEAGTRRQAFYSNLPPRNYTFRVLACNNSGVWNEEGASLGFSIAPAYYQTTWFRVSCMAAFLALLWGIYRLRIHQLQHQFAIGLEARVNERTRIARDLHDTLLQSFQGLMLHFQTGIDLLPGRPAEARKTLEIAIDRADQAIAEGRDAVQGLRASTVETNDLAAAVRILGEELRAEGTNQNSALFEMEVEGTPRNLHPILRDEVYRITGEALRNAFRHARAQRIEVEILYGERWLRLRVRDDGKGIDPKLLSGDGLAGHYGLHGMRERAKLVGGKLTVWSKVDSGTEVELSIPGSTAYSNPTHHRSWLSQKLTGKRTDFKETDVKETKTKS